MDEYIDYALPIIAAAVYLLLEERWKDNYTLSLRRHTAIITAKVCFCTVVTVALVVIFAGWLNATSLQLLPIVAIGFGCAYGVICYLLEPFYQQNNRHK